MGATLGGADTGASNCPRAPPTQVGATLGSADTGASNCPRAPPTQVGATLGSADTGARLREAEGDFSTSHEQPTRKVSRCSPAEDLPLGPDDGPKSELPIRSMAALRGGARLGGSEPLGRDCTHLPWVPSDQATRGEATVDRGIRLDDHKDWSGPGPTIRDGTAGTAVTQGPAQQLPTPRGRPSASTRLSRPLHLLPGSRPRACRSVPPSREICIPDQRGAKANQRAHSLSGDYRRPLDRNPLLGGRDQVVSRAQVPVRHDVVCGDVQRREGDLLTVLTPRRGPDFPQRDDGIGGANSDTSLSQPPLRSAQLQAHGLCDADSSSTARGNPTGENSDAHEAQDTICTHPRNHQSIRGEGAANRHGSSRRDAPSFRSDQSWFDKVATSKWPFHFSRHGSVDGLPGHVKEVLPLRLFDLVSTMAQDRRTRFDALWKELTLVPVCDSFTHFNLLRNDDLQRLLKAGYIQPASPGLKANCSAFLVPEPDKGRARIIVWPRAANNSLGKQEDDDFDVGMSLKDVTQIVDEVKPATFCLAVDMKISFFQVEVPPDVFIIQCGDTAYSLTRMPMGHCRSAEIMQLLCQQLAELAMRSTSQGPQVTCTVHIDNIRFLSQDRAVVNQIRRSLAVIATKFGVSFNEDLNDTNIVVQRGPFFGFDFDYANGTVELSDKMRGKLTGARDILADVPTCPVVRQFLHAAGILFFVSRALRHRLCAYFFAVKFVRYVCKQLQCNAFTLEAPLLIWESVRPTFLRWVDNLLNLPPTPTAPPSLRNITVFTDASFTGWGAVLDDSGVVQVYGERWKKDDLESSNINTLEVLALQRAIAHFADTIHGAAALWIVDNVSAKCAVSRAYSPSFAVNAAVNAAWRTCDRFDVKISDIQYIKSADNPADGPSRFPESFASGG